MINNHNTDTFETLDCTGFGSDIIEGDDSVFEDQYTSEENTEGKVTSEDQNSIRSQTIFNSRLDATNKQFCIQQDQKMKRHKQTQQATDDSMKYHSKKNNIVIHGLEEINELNDTAEVININNIIGNSNFHKHKIIRLGRIGVRNSEKPRPLKVELDSIVTKANIMRNANSLQNSSHYSNISIQHDLTKNQINELKHIKIQAIEVERNNPSDSHKYRVRGPPGFWKIVKLPKN